MTKYIIGLLLIATSAASQNKIVVKSAGGTSSSSTSFVANSVIAYGAFGDNATNNTTFIQAAIEATKAIGGGTVYFPSGTYLTNKLTSYNNVTLVGDGYSSILKSITADTVIVVKAGGNAYTSNVLINSLWIQGNASPVGIYCNGLANFSMYRTYVSGCTGGSGQGLVMKDCLVGTINNSGFSSNKTGVYGYKSANATTLVEFNDCVLNNNTKWAVDWSGGGQLEINNIDMEGNGVATDTISGGIYFHTNAWPGGLHVKGGWAEQNLGTVIAIDANTTGGFSNYPAYTSHSIQDFQDLGQNFSFTKRNIFIRGTNQKLQIIGGSQTGSVNNLIADGSVTVSLYDATFDAANTNLTRNGATIVTK